LDSGWYYHNRLKEFMIAIASLIRQCDADCQVITFEQTLNPTEATTEKYGYVRRQNILVRIERRLIGNVVERQLADRLDCCLDKNMLWQDSDDWRLL
jgi:hypothetical protein